MDIDVLRRLVSYDPLTGVLTWRESGLRALNHIHPRKYLSGKIHGRMFWAHRVAWAIHYGEWPSHVIDHINGNPSDNRIINLRVVTQAENRKNSRSYRTNKSGVTGVSWFARDGVWKASIQVNNKTLHIGYFKDIESAAAARKDAEIKHAFHPNHGGP